MSSRLSSDEIKAEAVRLGFFACGIAEAAPVARPVADAYRRWLDSGGHADMHYLADNVEKRLDPTLLVPGARSIIVVALNYAPARSLPADSYQLAAYAYGQDYHDVLKQRLRQLLLSVERFVSGGSTAGVQPSVQASQPSPLHKIATDTVPVLERYWAERAGLGFIGRNHQLIIPHAGSMFFLGEIITTAVADRYDRPMPNRCGTCRSCVDACPTGALDGETFCSSKCLSYLTIEHRGDIPQAVHTAMGHTIYGCDRCQQVCPWNRFARPTEVGEFQPSESLLGMHREDWQRLTVEQYRQLFKGSAVKRAKYEGLMRNIRAVASNDDGSDSQTVISPEP